MNTRKLFVLIVLAGLFFPSAVSGRSSASFSRVDLIPNIETAGVVVSESGLPSSAQLTYRRVGETAWRAGHPLVRLDDGRLAGSLFNLTPATAYEVNISDGAGGNISGSFTTQADELPFAPTSVIYVNANAPEGGDGSSAAPFQKIQDGVNRASAGTQVLVADGVYRESINFPASGMPGAWIQVKAEGAGAVLDSSETLAADVWIPHETNSRVWYTKIGPAIKYLARDGKRFYQYDDLTSLMGARGHNGVDVKEGWFYEAASTKLYIRSMDEPSRHTWNLPRLNHAFNVTGRDWIWIEGFEMRYYGADANGCGVCIVDASHVVIRRNRIHNMQMGIYINWTGGEDRGNDARIEFNEVSDPPVNEWAWKAVKGSWMEGTAIIVRGHIGAIVRRNDVHNVFNGIYTGSSGAKENPAVAFDADIYNNRVYNISDDAFEPEGACVNHRFRNNTVNNMLVGISIAPVTYGPVWVLRSTFANFYGTSIKWDLNPDGAVFIYHNTSWTNAAGVNGMSMIRTAHNVTMRNNIFQGNGYAFEEPFSGSTRHDWNYDNWHTTKPAPHFKWENVNYATIADLCKSTRLECNGHESPPGFVNPFGGDFTLLSNSPNVDRGVLIAGINDAFYGNMPDIGAFESVYGAPPPPSDTPNPTNTSAPVDTSTPQISTPVTVDASPTPFPVSTTPAESTPAPLPITSVFFSDGGNDGWVLEGKEDGNIGSSMNANAQTFRLGDDARNCQYRAILDFPTASLPDTAQVTKVILMIQLHGVVGENPFNTHRHIWIDIRQGAFGSFGPFAVGALQVTDFQAPASAYLVGTIQNNPVGNWYWSLLDAKAHPYVNLKGSTQLRLGFLLDDDNDKREDYLAFFSGNFSGLTDRPMLLVEYVLP